MHNNGYSLKILHSKIVSLKIASFDELINCIEKDFSKISIKKLFDVMLDEPIETINLSIHSCNVLHHSGGIYTINDLINKTKEGLYQVRNLGKKSFDEIIEKLHAHGLKLKDEE